MASTVRVPTAGQTPLRVRLAEARANTDSLFTCMQRSALYERPIPERHRLIFYLGHLEAFDWNLIGPGAAELPSFDERFDKLFAFGIDPVDGGLPSDVPSDWPSETEVRNYDMRVRGTLDAVLEDPTLAATRNAFFTDGTLLQVAIEHRLMHSETLAYLMHQLAFDQKAPQAITMDISAPVPAPHMVTIPSGVATLGKSRGSSFGWDNEFGELRIEVPEFRADIFPVTNAQYLEFVRSGGYHEPSLWAGADWKWREESGLEHPYLWRRSGEHWSWRGMFAEVPLPLAWPVYVSHAEASAFAKWAGKKLPTETQWHRVAYGSQSAVSSSTPSAAPRESEYPWGNEPPTSAHGNFDFHSWDPTAVNAHPVGQSEFGAQDLLGNGWEWTSSLFEPLPGFEAFPFYPGYSANFFDGHHYVMKGGSPRTAACMLRRSFRNWFQPHYPYVYAKFRCVED
jgi:gamma-glutamyl hercynylcysteine S-oxide synthase